MGVGRVHRNHIAGELGGPSGVVAELLHGQREIDGFDEGDRLAALERVVFGQLGGMALDQIGEPVQGRFPLTGGEPAPLAVEGRCGRSNRGIDRRLVTVGDLGDDRAGGRIDRVDDGSAGPTFVRFR